MRRTGIHTIKTINSIPVRCSFLILISALFVSACSSSSDLNTGSSQSDAVVSDDNGLVTDDGMSEVDSTTEVNTTELPQAVQANLDLVADKMFRFSWLPLQGAQFYRILENPDGVSGFSQISNDIEAASQYYDHRVALYNRINARYIVQACNANACVDSDELIVTGSLESAVGFVKSENSSRHSTFGGPVSLSADGNTLALGAPRESDSRDGAVYVFEHVDGKWRQEARLKASNADPGDLFGHALSLSADGNSLAVGAITERSAATGVNGDQNDNSLFNSGAVYVFVRSNGGWQQQAYLKASNTDQSDSFGGVVRMNFDGNTLAVGASGESSASIGIDGNQSDNSARGNGAVYLFVRNDGVWLQQAYLKAIDSTVNKGFGSSVALSASGSTLAVGHPGSVHLFERGTNGWVQQEHLQASILGMHGSAGSAVGLSGDGNTLVVGAPFEYSPATGINGNQHDSYPVEPTSYRGAGAAYVFVRSNESWQQEAYVKASNTDLGDEFGYQVTLSEDGNTLAVSAPRERSLATGLNGDQIDNSGGVEGAVYLYVRDSGSWLQRAYIKSTNREFDGPFGTRQISLSADGDTLAVGSAFYDTEEDEMFGDKKRFAGAYIY